MRTETSRPAIFLDRDGVINVDYGYVGDRERFEFMPGIFSLVRSALGLGFVPVVVTNQSGIARGLYDECDFLLLTEWMRARFSEEGAPLAAVYHCPYHPEASSERWRADHPDRKPRPGMLLAAAKDLAIDLSASVVLGDNLSDMEAGRAAGVNQLILLGDHPRSSPPVLSVGSLAEAERLITRLQAEKSTPGIRHQGR